MLCVHREKVNIQKLIQTNIAINKFESDLLKKNSSFACSNSEETVKSVSVIVSLKTWVIFFLIFCVKTEFIYGKCSHLRTPMVEWFIE